MIRVAIVEDEPSVRENLARLVEAAPGFTCVSALPTAELAAMKLPALLPEVVLMDFAFTGPFRD